ncbi:zinc transporter ZupT [bacterium BMS3Abin15]|nr:zinc transporter ZupT [bacterium BMS3Abin15]HDH07458.1 ZIP family metal transporter [Candidatus Moranbacteria bacterium]HDZ85627.1 ZIP family metal transporter [Candidatus Moranbacteria bacterium]
MVWIYTLISVVIVSAVSLIGIFLLSADYRKLNRTLVYIVSFAAGTLLGDAFIHLIPESFKNNSAMASLYILGGIIVFFILEKFIHWRHCHEIACDNHPHVMSKMILVGDTLHNFIDGIIIAASYLVSIPVGIATTIAVVLHEIPQEIGDFGSLVYGGYTRVKALMYNFLTATTAVLGAVLVLFINNRVENITGFLVPFAAGGFIYIAGTDIMPELHKSFKLKQSLGQLFFLLLGIGIMYALLFLG